MPSDTFPTMSCVPLNPDQQLVLETLAAGRPVPQRLSEVVAELQAWGWVMPGGNELTGAGMRHAGATTPGLLG